MTDHTFPPLARSMLGALIAATLAATATAATTAGANLQKTDPAAALPAGLAAQELRVADAGLAAGAAAAAAAPRPIAAPTAAEPRFDIAFNNAPAAQVFLQLANGTPYNMLVAPDVSGTLSITLRDTTLPEAMDTLRELFGYDFRITGNRVFVYSNAVQTRLFRINYLPGRRQGASDIHVTSSSITTSGAGTSGTGSTAPAPTSSSSTPGGMNSRADDSSHVRTTSDADFWLEVRASLASLVGTQGGRSVVLNPAAGVIVVRATPFELRQVENYLKAMQLSIERQVMLEAKIVQVQLSRESQTGINWAGFANNLGKNGKLTIGTVAPGTSIGTSGNIVSLDGSIHSPGASVITGPLGSGLYGLAFQAANFAALLNFLQTQGDVQVLSSPRIATLNNQKAVLKVGTDEFYVTGVTTSTTSTGSSTISSPSVTLQPFFSGIALDVTPQIDDAGNVMLHVHPSINVVSEKYKNIDLGSMGKFQLPLASSAINETDSIVRLRDGQIVAIGGLMKAETRGDRSGLPGLQDVPVVGGVFRQTDTSNIKSELVIMLKPTIIPEDGRWPNATVMAEPPAAAEPPK